MQYPVVLDMTQQHRRGTVLDFGQPYPIPGARPMTVLSA